MLKISKADAGYFVLDGANNKQRFYLRDNLPTEVRLVGDRVMFKPSPAACEFFLSLKGVELCDEFPQNAGIARDYTFEEKIKSYNHQQSFFEENKDGTGKGIFWEMGLGKTKTAIDIAAHKFISAQIDALVVITLKGVHNNWVNKELPEHMAIPYKAEAWPISTRKQDKILQHDGLIVLTINFDVIFRASGSSFLKRLLGTRKCMLVVDESHNIKTPTASRTVASLKFSQYKNARFRYVMTGTPIANAPLDLWSQMKFIKNDIWCDPDKDTFQRFKNRYAIMKVLPGVTVKKRLKSGQVIEYPVKVIVGYKNIDELNATIAPYVSRLTKVQCLDLPDKIFITHAYELSDEQRKAYRELMDECVTEINGQRISSTLKLTIIMRLQQLTCGFLRSDTGELVAFPSNPRLEALKDVTAQIQRQGIIWTTFNESNRQIVEALRKEYGEREVVVYTGATSDADRYDAISRFQSHKAKFFVGNPQAGGTGITLTAARDVVYYNNSYNLIMRLQSEDRAHRIGQKYAVTYTDLVALKTIDEKIVKALIEKLSLASLVTGDEFKKWLSN